LDNHVVDIFNHLGYLAGVEYGRSRGYGTQATQNAHPNYDFGEELPFLVLVLLMLSPHAFSREKLPHAPDYHEEQKAVREHLKDHGGYQESLTPCLLCQLLVLEIDYVVGCH
jgi:hypothetical protein